MKKNTILILLIILVLLIIINLVIQQKKVVYDLTGGFVSLLPKDFKTDNIAKVEIYRGSKSDEKVVLKNELGEWKVASAFSYKANKDKMERFLNDLKGLEGEQRTSTDKVFDEFQISDEKGIHLVLLNKDDKPIVHYVLGKPGPTYSDCFLRYIDKKDVYLASKNLLSHIGVYGEPETKVPENKTWLDLNVLKINREKVVMVIVHKPEGEIILKKEFIGEEKEGEKKNELSLKPEAKEETPKPKEYKWLVTKPEKFEPDKNKAEQIASSLSNISATDAVQRDNPESYGLKDPQYYAILKLNDDTEKKLLFGIKREDTGDYFFKLSDSKDIYVVRSYTFDNVFKKEIKDLKPEEKKPEVKKPEAAPASKEEKILKEKQEKLKAEVKKTTTEKKDRL